MNYKYMILKNVTMITIIVVDNVFIDADYELYCDALLKTDSK
jgi:hypothetical protein